MVAEFLRPLLQARDFVEIGKRNASPNARSAQIRSNQRDFFIGYSRLVLFHGAMQAGQGTSSKLDPRFVTADHAAAVPRALRTLRLQMAEDGATSARAAIVSSLFLVVLAFGLLLGGHAAIDPLLRSAMASREAKGMGDVLYAMPDGIYCRHLSFDNATAEVAESAIAHCPDDVVRDHAHGARGFAWGH